MSASMKLARERELQRKLRVLNARIKADQEERRRIKLALRLYTKKSEP